METIAKTKDLSQYFISETDLRGTVCGKAARTDLWGSGEATNRSTRNMRISWLSGVRACQVLHLTVFQKIEDRKEKRKKREDDIRSGLLICEENIIFLYKLHPFEPPHNLCNGQYIALTIFHDSV